MCRWDHPGVQNRATPTLTFLYIIWKSTGRTVWTHPRQLHGDREKQKYLSQEDTRRGREAFPRVRMQRETCGAAAESGVFTRQAEVVPGQEQLRKQDSSMAH